jgi:predicted metal-dependent hydrolase
MGQISVEIDEPTGSVLSGNQHKKPPQCLEYIVVHELAHFFERNHSDRFVAFMDRLLPKWRSLRDELNAEPLSHEEWDS